MTALSPIHNHHGLSNQFKALATDKMINFRNESMSRDNVSAVEIRGEANHLLTEIVVDTKDNVAMALSMLGIGRVTDDAERSAQLRADMILAEDCDHSIEGVLKQAVINLRAILIAQEREKEASEAEIKDAYALYALAYPKTNIGFEEFKSATVHKFWLANLHKVRKDPTVLGSL